MREVSAITWVYSISKQKVMKYFSKKEHQNLVLGHFEPFFQKIRELDLWEDLATKQWTDRQIDKQ